MCCVILCSDILIIIIIMTKEHNIEPWTEIIGLSLKYLINSVLMLIALNNIIWFVQCI